MTTSLCHAMTMRHLHRESTTAASPRGKGVWISATSAHLASSRNRQRNENDSGQEKNVPSDPQRITSTPSIVSVTPRPFS